MSDPTPPAKPRREHDAERPLETSPVVLAAVCTGIAPLPFLAVYAVLFIVHALHPIGPPDITASRTGELVAGVVAFVAFALLAAAALSYLNQHRRWPFVLLQAATFVTTVLFLRDATTGGPAISWLLAATSIAAFVLALAPASARHVGSPVGRGRTKANAPT